MNAYFHAKDANAKEMIKELTLHYKSLESRALDHRGHPLPINRMDLGAKFSLELRKYMGNEEHSIGLCANTELRAKGDTIKRRCAEMLMECITQVKQRLPSSQSIFKGLSNLAPSKVLSQTDRVPFKDLPMQYLFG